MNFFKIINEIFDRIIDFLKSRIENLNQIYDKFVNKKIKNYDSNYENILQDSDVVVLQQNYDYLFWSIIAITTVIISMNIVKNN